VTYVGTAKAPTGRSPLHLDRTITDPQRRAPSGQRPPGASL